MLSGEQFRIVRKERQFTIEQIAGYAGIDISTLSKFELEKGKLSEEVYALVWDALKQEKITKEDYKNPNLEKFRKEKKKILANSKKLVKQGLKTEKEHQDLIDSLKLKQKEAQNEDYKLNERKKIKLIKENIQKSVG